jgi:acetolactate synthase-1/2/3 large subunit
VEVVFGLPGGQTAALYDAIDAGEGITHVGVLDERSAAYAADAYARLTGRVGVCDATVGPGTAKLPSGLGEAFNSSVPIVALVSELPRSTEARRYRGATSQALDQEALLAPVTKWVGTVREAEQLGPVVRRAFREATSGRPGPVAVILPQDVLDGQAPAYSQADDPHAGRFGRFPSTKIPPEPEDLEALNEAISSSSRPLLVLGGGARQAWGVVAELAEACGLAVATTLSGKGTIDERHPMAVGVLGALGNPAARAVGERADLIVLAGTKWGSGTTAGWSLPRAGQRVAHIDIDPVELGRDRPVEIAVCADAATTLGLVDRSPVGRDAWRSEVSEATRAWREARRALWASASTPIDPQRVMSELGSLVGPTDVVIADASLSSGWVGSFLEVTAAGPRTLFPRGLAGLGWAIPAAIGAAEATSGRIVAVMGDGAAPYAIGELATLAGRGAPVLMVVLNNGSYGWIRWYRRLNFGRGWEEPDLPSTSFADVAAAYGLSASRVEDPDALGDALSAGLGEVPALVEVVTSVWETPIAAHRQALDDQEEADY